MLRVPGMGTMKGRWASSHARAIWAGVAFFALAQRVRRSTKGRFACRFSGLRRGKPERTSVLGSKVVLESIFTPRYVKMV